MKNPKPNNFQTNMAKIINASIDLSKIDESKCIAGKNGSRWYNISIAVNDERDQYDNDAAIYERQSKEDRDAKTKKRYLGNGRTAWSSDSIPGAAERRSAGSQEPMTHEPDNASHLF